MATAFARRFSRYSVRFICNSSIYMSQRLNLPNGEYLEYHHLPGKLPGIMFLPGLMSSMSGTKAMALEKFCLSTGRAYTRFDHRGMGLSSGKAHEFTIGSRKQDVLNILDAVKGPQILVGSSLGGWIMLLVAMEIPHRIPGLIGIATAVDFIKRRFDSLPDETKTFIENTGKWEIPTPYNETPYILSWDMIQEARKHELNENIQVNCPVRLIHGMNDQEVPYDISIYLANNLQSNDVQVTLIKNGTHRLSEPKDIEIITRTIDQLFQDINAKHMISNM